MTHEEKAAADEGVYGKEAAVGLSAGLSAGILLGLLVFDNIGAGLALGTSLGLTVPVLRRSLAAKRAAARPGGDGA
ncbi:hypothetical protein QEZ40_000756 [Streptomyces katrae]|uniref:Glycine zipper family protein n=1 Tax=Streptomyces katrae TaxID=68223 RepID=A0ABT7GRT2_9ACTN|nr:hypothetical protein [Streptomyces katrae]MDK9496307.1 hypothetical protein [Streptomyces katrae]